MEHIHTQGSSRTDNKPVISRLSQEMNIQVSDPNAMRGLIATTFSAFKNKPREVVETIVKQACLEAMVRGYSFEDILRKKVYAIPFGKSYALVQSINDIRTIAQKSGHSGTSEPRYEETKDGNIKSCAVTVWKDGGHPEGYSAIVYFEEYYKSGNTYQGVYNPSMWDKKPRTMIAKVAEAHALRKAFPEVLDQSYVEEEFHKESDDVKQERKNIAEAVKETDAPTVGSITKSSSTTHHDDTHTQEELSQEELSFSPTPEEEREILAQEREEAEVEHVGEETADNTGK